MWVTVKPNKNAFYDNTYRTSGDKVNYKGAKCPEWAVPCENKKQNKPKETENTKQNTFDLGNKQTENNNSDEKENDETELLLKFSALLDEAVGLGISYEPSENIPIQQRINELSQLIENKK